MTDTSCASADPVRPSSAGERRLGTVGSNVAELVWSGARRHPEKMMLRCSGNTWTYVETRDAVAVFASDMQRLHVAPGDNVVLIVPTGAEFVIAYLGLLTLGATVVPMSPAATRRELEHVIDDCHCRLVVVWHENADAATAATRARDVLLRVVTPLTPDRASSVPAQVYAAAPDQRAVILYTSGTTGRPKGVELTHGNLLACARTFTDVLRVGDDDVFGTSLPLFHVFGGAVILGTAAMTGASISLLPRFSAPDAVQMIADDGVTVFAGVPTMYNAMIQLDPQKVPALNSLRLCLSGGASMPQEMLNEFRGRFGATILEGYGLTESAGAGTFTALDRPRVPGSVGIPLPGFDVRIVDECGRDVDVGDVGELILKSPTLMRGYWGLPDASASTLRDGWLYTGDLARSDETGETWIVGRRKHLIVRGGYNVYPREVEDVLYEHPAVVEAAVVGVADDRLGEEVAAVVALTAAGAAEISDLQDWCRRHLSSYKVPRMWQVVKELPRGATGKTLRPKVDRAGLTYRPLRAAPSDEVPTAARLQ